MFYIPELNPTVTKPIPGVSQYMAPVVQANPGSDQHELNSKFSDYAKKAAVDVGKEFAISALKAFMPRQSQH